MNFSIMLQLILTLLLRYKYRGEKDIIGVIDRIVFRPGDGSNISGRHPRGYLRLSITGACLGCPHLDPSAGIVRPAQGYRPILITKP